MLLVVLWSDESSCLTIVLHWIGYHLLYTMLNYLLPSENISPYFCYWKYDIPGYMCFHSIRLLCLLDTWIWIWPNANWLWKVLLAKLSIYSLSYSQSTWQEFIYSVKRLYKVFSHATAVTLLTEVTKFSWWTLKGIFCFLSCFIFPLLHDYAHL